MKAFIITSKVSELRPSRGILSRSPTLRPCRTVPDKIRKALSRNKMDDFWALVKAGADIDTRDRVDRTPLHLVIYWKKDLAVVKAVLSAGADPNAIDYHGLSPLHAAIQSNSSPTIVKALLSAGADIDLPDSRGRSPLMKCLHKKDNIPVIRTLLSAGANVKLPNLMVEAIKAKTHHEVLRLFLMAGASANDTWCGFPPIFYAVLNSDIIVVKMLLVAGASVDFLHPENRSTLLHQVTVGEIAQELIKHGMDVNAVDIHGETPLHRAVMGDHLDVVMVLIKAGAYVHSVVQGKGNNCLHLAKSAPIIKILVLRGVDINARNRRGESPLHTVVINCSLLLLSPLMNIRGLHVRYFKDTNSIQMNEGIMAVKEMLKSGANVNAIDNNDNSVLELVVIHGHSKMVSYMIKRGLEIRWKKLFRLNVINQSAIQLLIRESIIGNVKGDKFFDCNPSEEPLLRSMKQLLAYANRCLAEIELMKAKKINCNNTIYHFVVEIAPKIKALRLCAHYEVSDEEYSAMFPIYRYQVAVRLNQCYKRALLFDILEYMKIQAPTFQGKGMVNLINDCKFAIAKYLSNHDLFNFLVAMGFDVSENGVCPASRSCEKCGN